MEVEASIEQQSGGGGLPPEQDGDGRWLGVVSGRGASLATLAVGGVVGQG